MIAREVVEPGTEGLAALVDAFGEEILLPDGALNRPALAAKAFVDDEQRAKLNGIVHPLVGTAARRDHRRGIRGCRGRRGHPAARRDRDGADVSVGRRRVRRRRDSGHPADQVAGWPRPTPGRASPRRPPTSSAGRLPMCCWTIRVGRANSSSGRASCGIERVLPLAHNIRTRQTVAPPPALVPYDPSWPDAGPAHRRPAPNRLRSSKALRVDHIGSTAVPGLDAKDVIDIQVTVASLATSPTRFADALPTAGYPRKEHITADVAKPDARSTVPDSTTPTIRPCGRSDFTRRPTPADPPTSISGSTAGPASSSRCCSPTGWWPTPACARTTWPLKRRRVWRRTRTTPTPRNRGSSTPTGARGSGPTPPAGGPSFRPAAATVSTGGAGSPCGCAVRRRCRDVGGWSPAAHRRLARQCAVVRGRPCWV